MNRTDLERELSQTETLDANSSRVAALLRALPRVEAPANFEFGVKAKIAAGRRSGGNPLPFFKVAAPLGLVLLVIATVIFYGSLPSDSSSPTVAGAVEDRAVDQTASELPVETPIDIPAQSQPTERAETRTPKVAAEPNRSGPVRVTPARPRVAPNGGSVDKGFAVAEVIEPPGFESGLGRNRNVNSGSPNASPGIPIVEILETLGLRAKFVSGAWMVQSIRRNSIGDRSGLQVNDLIEAFGDQVLGAGTTLKGGFEGKTMRIRRGDKQISIAVKN